MAEEKKSYSMMGTSASTTTSRRDQKRTRVLWRVLTVILLFLCLVCISCVVRLANALRETQTNLLMRVAHLEEHERASGELVTQTIRKIVEQIEMRSQHQPKQEQRKNDTSLKYRSRNRVKRENRDNYPPQPRDEKESEQGKEFQRTIHSFRREMFSLNDR